MFQACLHWNKTPKLFHIDFSQTGVIAAGWQRNCPYAVKFDMSTNGQAYIEPSPTGDKSRQDLMKWGEKLRSKLETLAVTDYRGQRRTH